LYSVNRRCTEHYFIENIERYGTISEKRNGKFLDISKTNRRKRNGKISVSILFGIIPEFSFAENLIYKIEYFPK